MLPGRRVGYIEDFSKMQVIVNRIEQIRDALEQYAQICCEVVRINRIYTMEDEIQVNFSVKGCKWVISLYNDTSDVEFRIRSQTKREKKFTKMDFCLGKFLI